MNWNLVIAVSALLAAAGPVLGQEQTDVDQPVDVQPDLLELQSAVDAAAAERSAAKAILDKADSDLKAAQAALTDAVPLKLTEGWGFNAQIGVNGSTGNTERFSYRVAVRGSRSTKKLDTSLSLTYSYATDDGTKTDNRLVLAGRNDWKFEGSRWRVFVNGKYEYDEFQDWDQRLSGFVGVGYDLIKKEKHSLVGRAGLGGNQTLGGTDETFTPEGFLGLDYQWTISDRQRFNAGLTYFPSLDKMTDFRIEDYAEYQLVLSAESNMILTAGVEHRHDSDPGTAKKNDLDYYLTLGWQF